jgi:hypothetical protein
MASSAGLVFAVSVWADAAVVEAVRKAAARAIRNRSKPVRFVE